MKKKLPNFLIVGAGKSGSTSLYMYLLQHPDVFMPVNKEPNFFVADYQSKTNPVSPSYKDDKKRMVFDQDNYYKLFENVENEKVIGEATVTYLYRYDEAIPKIKHILGNDTKIVIILRNPIERTFSNYAYATELGYENLTYKEALFAEEERLKNHWASIFAYQGQSEYYLQVKAYKEAFKNVHVILMDDLKSSPRNVMKALFQFLELRDIEVEFNEVFNPTGIPKNRVLHNFLNQRSLLKDIVRTMLTFFISKDKLREYARRMRQKNILKRMKNDDKEVEHLLHERFDPQIELLEKLIDKDLTMWYSNS